MSIRDLRLVVKLASLIRDQERRVYYEQLLNLRESQMSESQKNMFTKLRGRNERLAELARSERDFEI